jgi:hypothetical protein
MKSSCINNDHIRKQTTPLNSWHRITQKSLSPCLDLTLALPGPRRNLSRFLWPLQPALMTVLSSFYVPKWSYGTRASPLVARWMHHLIIELGVGYNVMAQGLSRYVKVLVWEEVSGSNPRPPPFEIYIVTTYIFSYSWFLQF